MKIIHLEDDVIKYSTIKRVLVNAGIRNDDVVWTDNVEDGIEQIEKAIKDGEPFELAITDQHYPVKKGMKADWDAGEIFIDTIENKGIAIPIIVCSSMNMNYKNVYGNVWYSELSNWEAELQAYIKKLKQG